MAISRDNVVTYGLSGILQILQFSQRAGKTIVGKRRRHSSKPATALQEAVQARFKLAVAYAQAIKSNTTLYAAYAKAAVAGQSAFNVAFADYFDIPEVTDIDVSGYTGAISSSIKVKAVDDFEVKTVHVRIVKPDNTLVEEGDAVADANGVDWIYTATTANAALTGDIVTATATDNAGNTGSLQKTLA